VIVNGALGPELVQKEQALSGQASDALRLARLGRAPGSVRPPSGAVALDAPRAPRLDAKRVHSAERPVPKPSRGRALLIAIALLGLAIGAVAGFLLRQGSP
jgi:hypothetical protein